MADVAGTLVTPPVACGLLPGTLRAHLLASGTVSERVLRVQELPSATALWLVNAVRGWVPITLVEPPEQPACGDGPSDGPSGDEPSGDEHSGDEHSGDGLSGPRR